MCGRGGGSLQNKLASGPRITSFLRVVFKIFQDDILFYEYSASFGAVHLKTYAIFFFS